MKVNQNPIRRRTSVMLEKAGKESDARIWALASDVISAVAKSRVQVNIGRIARVSQAGQAVFVPGKVLGTGLLDKKLVVGAFAFSGSARSKIEGAGGTALSVEEFVKKFPKGSGVKLVE